MGVATTTEYWTTRVDGGDPTDPPGTQNEAFAGSAGVADGKNWKISASSSLGYYTLTPTTTAYTLWIAFSYTDSANLPEAGTVIAELDNGTHQVQIQATGTAGSIEIVGAQTKSFTGLDLIMAEVGATPISIRLTLDASGNAKAYLWDIIEDDSGTDYYLSVTGATGASKTATWGNDDGEVTYYTTYLTTQGVFGPDELALGDYTTTTLVQTAFGILDVLKDSSRYHLKSVVQDNSMVYGYDISSNMMTRQVLPTIQILIRRISSPDMYGLAGQTAQYEFEVEIYVVTKGTNYRDAYRQGMEIVGEVIDEVYTKTGLQGSTDSLLGHDARLDSRLDPDDQICVHVLNLRYMRRVDMHRRALV